MLIPAQQIADDIILNVQAAQVKQDFVATGLALKSWYSVVRENRILIYGQDYTLTNWKGLPPGTNVKLLDIARWMVARRMRGSASAVTQKLILKGDRVYRKEREGLQIPRAIEAALTKHKTGYEKIMLFNIEQQLKAAWQSPM